MKINITIEIDDKELKGLFKEESTEEKVETEREWDVWYDMKCYAEYFYKELYDLAEKYSQIDLETYKKLMNYEANLLYNLPINDGDYNIGWTFEDIKKTKIVRDRCGYGYAYRIALPEPVQLQWW